MIAAAPVDCHESPTVPNAVMECCFAMLMVKAVFRERAFSIAEPLAAEPCPFFRLS